MIEHLSYSSIAHYLTCPRSWKHRYIDGVRGETAEAPLFGRLMHKAIELNLVGGGDLSESFEAAAQSVAENELPYSEILDADLIDYGRKFANIRLLRDTVTNLEPATIGEQKAIEYKTEFTVSNVDVPVIGFIDCFTADGVAVDYKTSSSSWSQDKADNELQASFYAAALFQNKLVELPMKFRYVVLVKNKTPKVQIIDTERGFEDVLRVYRLVHDVYQAIKKGMFVANPTAWKCNSEKCDAWQYCKGGLL